MDMQLLKKVEEKFIKKLPEFEVGDTISVHTVVREGDKKRVQIFRGIVLGIKGTGVRRSFTVRKISYGVGVEKILPLHSPNIEKIEVLKKGKVRRAKIYYMRKRIGKQALKIDEGEMLAAVTEGEAMPEEIVPETAKVEVPEVKAEAATENAPEQTA